MIAKRVERYRLNPVLMVFLALGGCAPSGSLMPKQELVPEEPPTRFDDRDWSAVLRENVRKGMVDYDHLAKNRDPLDRYLAMISVVGPEATPALFPDRDSQIAYWINAYNAEVLNIVLSLHPVKSLYELNRPDPETGYTFKVDGKTWKLGGIRERLLNLSGKDMRIYFALCAGAMFEPDLRNRPYRPGTLAVDLAQAAADAMNNPRIVKINHEKMELRIWWRMLSDKDAFIAYHKRRMHTRAATMLSVLLEFADPQRRAYLNKAIAYNLRTIPPNRKLNQWTPAP